MVDEKLIEHIKFFDRAFPKYELLIEEMIAEVNKVIVHGRAKRVHKGEYKGIPPTGDKMYLLFVIRYVIENDKITDIRLVADNIILMGKIRCFATLDQSHLIISNNISCSAFFIKNL